MEFFLGFLFLSAVVGMLLRKRSQAATVVVMLLVSAFVVFGYFFLNQI